MSSLIDAFECAPQSGELQPVADGVWWLRMPLPFELDHINLYLIETADSWVLVDSGLAGQHSRAIWQTLFAGPLSGKPLSQVICTHYHPDHVGGAGWLCEQQGARLLISDPEYVATVEQLQLAKDHTRQRTYLEQLGVESDDALAIASAAEGLLSMYDPLPSCWQSLEAGQSLQLGEHCWQVQLADGHSPAHATLYCETLGVLISGDQVLPRISSNVSVRLTAPEANPLACWLKGLQQLYALPEQTLVLPAHDQPFYGLHRRLQALEAGHNQLLIQLESLLTAAPQTVLQLTRQLYRRPLQGFNLVLALGECQAHLHYLAAQQRAQADFDGEARRLFSR